jgi:NADH-quinone oxidoreductase subunit N
MIVYLVIYVVTGFLTWSLLLTIESFFNGENTKTIADTSNFFKLNGAFSLVIASSFFSLAGIPPFCGFYAKFSVLCSVINASFFFYAIVAFLISVISCFYYLRLIKNAFFEKHLKWFSYIRFDILNSFTISVFTILLTGLFINPAPLLFAAQKMILFF